MLLHQKRACEMQGPLCLPDGHRPLLQRILLCTCALKRLKVRPREGSIPRFACVRRTQIVICAIVRIAPHGVRKVGDQAGAPPPLLAVRQLCTEKVLLALLHLTLHACELLLGVLLLLRLLMCFHLPIHILGCAGPRYMVHAW